MAKFDFIDSAAKGYEFVWKERSYLLRVVVPVIFIKTACLFAVIVLGVQDNYLRQGLVNMPGFVIEAIFVAGLIRYIIYKEPIFVWGKLIIPPDTRNVSNTYNGSMSRKQCLQAAIVLYLLLRIIEVFLISFSLENTQSVPHDEISEEVIRLSPEMASAVMFISLFVFIWLFKFFWLFIPVALGYKMSSFLKRIRGIRDPISMIAIWLICSLPVMVVFSVILQIISSSFVEGSAESIILTSILKTITEMTVISLQVSAMTYGINQVLSGKEY